MTRIGITKIDTALPSDHFQSLVRGCQDGCEVSRDRLAKWIHPRAYEIARRLCTGGRIHSLHATSLLNEAFMRLCKGGLLEDPKSEEYVYAAAGKMMRNVISDYIRKKKALKRLPPGDRRYQLDHIVDRIEQNKVQYEDLNEAIDLLSDLFPRQAAVVQLRYLFEMTIAETANVLGVSAATVENDWRQARTWLYKQLLA